MIHSLSWRNAFPEKFMTHRRPGGLHSKYGQITLQRLAPTCAPGGIVYLKLKQKITTAMHPSTHQEGRDKY